MRYFVLIFVVACLAVVGIAGKRGSISRRPPLEFFPDMNRQPKLRPQNVDTFFADGRSSREPVEGTVAHENLPYEMSHTVESPVNTGRQVGKTNFIENIPVPVTAALLARGQQRFTINCSPCHGAQGDGKGITVRVGAMPPTPKNLHDKLYVEMPDGEIFNTITYGKNLMGPYGANVTVEDRWAIVAYLRALQLSQLGTMDDVPEGMRAKLKK